MFLSISQKKGNDSSEMTAMSDIFTKSTKTSTVISIQKNGESPRCVMTDDRELQRLSAVSVGINRQIARARNQRGVVPMRPTHASEAEKVPAIMR